jgi:hypothetical protein
MLCFLSATAIESFALLLRRERAKRKILLSQLPSFALGSCGAERELREAILLKKARQCDYCFAALLRNLRPSERLRLINFVSVLLRNLAVKKRLRQQLLRNLGVAAQPSGNLSLRRKVPPGCEAIEAMERSL